MGQQNCSRDYTSTNKNNETAIIQSILAANRYRVVYINFSSNTTPTSKWHCPHNTFIHINSLSKAMYYKSNYTSARIVYGNYDQISLFPNYKPPWWYLVNSSIFPFYVGVMRLRTKPNSNPTLAGRKVSSCPNRGIWASGALSPLRVSSTVEAP